MNTLIEKELERYILLIKKSDTINENHYKAMISGLEAMLSCLKKGTDIDEVVNDLYRCLENDKKTLDEYLDLTRKLDELNAPVVGSEIQYIIAGIDSLRDSQEFIDNNDGKFDFFNLFKIFSKFSADAAHLSNCSESDIDSKYPGLSEDIDFTTPEGKTISRKYKFLAKFFKILAQILVMCAYILNAVAGASKILGDRIKRLYRSEFQSLKSLQKSVDKIIIDISKSIREMEGQANNILGGEYSKLVRSREELQSIYNKLESQVKFDIVAEALHSKKDIFAPILDPKNRDTFAKLAQSTESHKQDQFTGLTGILNTRPDLSQVRISMKEIFDFGINDAIIMAVFAACVTIAKEASVDIPSFKERLRGGQNSSVIAPA